MKLSYKAITHEGKTVFGVLEAKDPKEGAIFLQRNGFVPVTLSEKKESDLSKALPFLNRVKKKDVVFFTRQLSSMLDTGLTLLQSMTILLEQMEGTPMGDIIGGIIGDIQDGRPFSYGITRYPKVFSPIYVSLIKAAEVSGLLDKILLNLADNLEKEQKLKSTIKSAMMYPIIILIAMTLVISVMMIFVIPQLSSLYASLNVSLPLPTRIVVAMSDFMVHSWFLLIGMIAIFVFAYRKWHGTYSGKRIIDTYIIKIPVFGHLIVESTLTEFSRTSGMLVGSGNLVIEAFRQTAAVIDNTIYREAIVQVAQRVEKGVPIGEAMGAYVLFPPILVQMVKIGEQTGKLDEQLLRMSEYYEREVSQSVKNLTVALEPIILLVLGVGVGFLIIAIITPIYSLTNAIH